MANAHILGERGNAPAVPRIGAGARSVFVQKLDLSAGFTNKEISISGDSLAAIEGTPGAKVSIRFNLSGGGVIPFRVGARISGLPFDRLLITADAQPLKTLTLVSSRGELDIGSGIVTVETDPTQTFQFLPSLSAATPNFTIFDPEIDFATVPIGSTLGQITGERVKSIKIFFPERHLSGIVNAQLNLMGTLSGQVPGAIYHTMRPGDPPIELGVTDLQPRSTNIGLQVQRDPASVTVSVTAYITKVFSIA